MTIVDALKWATPEIPGGKSQQRRRLASCRGWSRIGQRSLPSCGRSGISALGVSLVPLGVADDRYRTDVCQGNEDAATYSRPSLAFLLPSQDFHANPPKGGVNPAFAT